MKVSKMVIPRDLPEQELVQCDICLKEIPVSEASNVEAVEYIMHFCGLECYQKWSHGQGEEEDQDRPA
ncbi:MAG TPA: DUF3330 domain-containing protein [Chromatiales bacterium]|nr:DUF3330 domain-containing protein [Chromatiales bacterium]